jgi:ACS family tartrate transporter-like MFS transporter
MALVLSYTSDRWQERKWHMLVPTFFAGVSMLLAAQVGQGHQAVLLVCFTLTIALWFGRIATFWVMVGDAVPKDAAGPSMAIANGVGNFGGFLGPFVFGWLRTMTDNFDAAMIFGGVSFVLATVIVMPMRFGPALSAVDAPASHGAYLRREYHGQSDTAPRLVRRVAEL